MVNNTVAKATGITVVSQRKEYDCGLACLAMLLGMSYGDVAQKVKEIIDPKSLRRRGLILRDVETLLEAWGHVPTRHYKSKGYLEGATGILGLNGGLCDPCGHWVIIKNGMIIDPSGGEVWSVDDYCKQAKCRTAALVTI